MRVKSYFQYNRETDDISIQVFGEGRYCLPYHREFDGTVEGLEVPDALAVLNYWNRGDSPYNCYWLGEL